MTAVAIRYSPLAALSLPRVGAWSTSISIHLAALALLLSAPVAYRLVNSRPTEEAVAVRFIEQKPVAVVKDLDPPPIVRRPSKAHLATPVVVPVESHEPTAVSIATETDIAPPTIETGPAVQAQPDSEPSAIAYGARTSVPYPHESLKAREQGTVMLLVLVGADGKVDDIRIEKSSGYARLDRAARDAVKLWNFNPAHHGGIAERAWAKVPISFSLSAM